MKYLLIKKGFDGCYFENNSNDGYLEALGRYLVDGNARDSLIEWIKNQRCEGEVNGNSFYLRVYTNNMIGVGMITLEDEDPYEFKMPKENLIEIMLKWREVKQQSPEIILLTREGTKVELKLIFSESELPSGITIIPPLQKIT